MDLLTNVYIRIIIFLALFGVYSCQTNESNQELNYKLKSQDTLQLFNGSDFTGWNNNYPDNWIVENGMLIGTTLEKLIDNAIWITTESEFDDFILEMQVKLIGDENKNTGVYYRGQWDGEHVVGYELDIGGWGDEDDAVWWGQLHDPYRREDLWIGPEGKDLQGVYHENEWNYIKIIVNGNHIQHWVNNTKTVDWFEQDSTIKRMGFIGFQLHDETKNKVHFKDIKLIRLDNNTIK